MSKRLADLPFIVILMGLGALAMLIPAAHGVAVKDYATARIFFYSAVLFLVLFAMLALATANVRVRRQGRSHLLSMLAFYAVLPVILAVPVSEIVPDTRFLKVYVEMVSSITTTGLTLFEPERLPASVHLWRAVVGWFGGFFVWVTAIAILAPLNLGGFEVSSPAEIGQGAAVGTEQIERVADVSERLRRFALKLAPVYGGLSLALWVSLVIAGEDSFTAACHAMSTLSTSGITPGGGTEMSSAGIPGEAAILVFLIFALSRRTFSPEDWTDGLRSLTKDRELRFGLVIIGGVSVLLFLRHWLVSVESGTGITLTEILRGFWGSVFTVASYLTTTGFVSSEWDTTQTWSGLGSPGVLLLGLAVFGGGVATTAGGVKLLRVVALYKHGMRELERLVQPSSVGGAGQQARRFRRQGAYVAWVFFMLFAISIAVVMCALSLTDGLDFEDTMILTIAALSTTGPLLGAAGEVPIALTQLSDLAWGIVTAAMILGRLETLAIIALLNPEFWR